MRFCPIIYLFILTGSLLLSCKKEEVVPVELGIDGRIAFGLEGIAVSKAVQETTVSEIAANGFNVAGVMSEGMVFFNETAIKDETGATTRCIPFAQEKLGDVCVHCGKPAKHMVYFGKAY